MYTQFYENYFYFISMKNMTPLMEASRRGKADITRLLMEYGADPNTVNGVS